MESNSNNTFLMFGASAFVLVIIIGGVVYFASPRVEKPVESVKNEEQGLPLLTAEQKAVRRVLVNSVKRQVALDLELYYDKFGSLPETIAEFSSQDPEKLKLIEYRRVDSKNAEICIIETLETDSCRRAIVQADGSLYINTTFDFPKIK